MEIRLTATRGLLYVLPGWNKSFGFLVDGDGVACAPLEDSSINILNSTVFITHNTLYSWKKR